MADEGTKLPFQLVEDNADPSENERGFVAQDELEEVSHNNDIGLVFNPTQMNNVALYNKLIGVDGSIPPFATTFTRAGTVGNSWMEIGTVSTNNTGVIMPEAGSVVKVMAADNGNNDYIVQVGFNNLNNNSYPVQLPVINSSGVAAYAVGIKTFAAGDVMRAHIKKNPDNSSNPVVSVIVRFA